MNVLSLCDGMSCAHIALDKAGIKVDRYFASEIKDIAIKCTQENYPDTVQIGDVNKVHYKDGVLYWEGGSERVKIDLVCFGSPCQTFSIAIPDEFRTGLENKEKSGLFFECKRILDEVNPAFWLMENVRSMKNEDRDYISSLLGREPYMIDAADFGPAIRKRYYWTNIQIGGSKNYFYKECEGYTQISPCGRKLVPDLADILDSHWTEREKARCLAVIDSRPNTTPVKMFHRYYSTGFTTLLFKDEAHYNACVAEYEKQSGGKRKCTDTSKLINSPVFEGVRYLNRRESERCQGVPEGYTDCVSELEAKDLLGDGWNIDVIAFIFGGIF